MLVALTYCHLTNLKQPAFFMLNIDCFVKTLQLFGNTQASARLTFVRSMTSPLQPFDTLTNSGKWTLVRSQLRALWCLPLVDVTWYLGYSAHRPRQPTLSISVNFSHFRCLVCLLFCKITFQHLPFLFLCNLGLNNRLCQYRFNFGQFQSLSRRSKILCSVCFYSLCVRKYVCPDEFSKHICPLVTKF